MNDPAPTPSPSSTTVPGGPVGVSPAAAPPPPPSKRKPNLVMIIAAVLAVVAIIVGISNHIYGLSHIDTDDAFIDGDVIPVSPQVAGILLTVPVIANHRVHRGDVLFTIDPRNYQTAYDEAKARADEAKARLAEAHARLRQAAESIAEAQAEVDVYRSGADRTHRDLVRYQQLSADATTREQLDQVGTADRTAQARLRSAEAAASAAVAAQATAQAEAATIAAALEAAVAGREQARLNLSYTTVTSPTDGRIASKAAEVGAYAAVGDPLMAIVSDQLWVTANFKETQLADMRVGQRVVMSVDAFPDLHLHGRVESLQPGTGSRFSLFPAENATGNYVKVVQRLPIRISLDPGQAGLDELSPGMSVQPTVLIH